MERFKRILNKILFPHLALVFISVPVAVALLIYTFLYEEETSPVAYISYLISAYSLIIVCAWLIKMPKEGFRDALHRNQYVHRYLTDVAFKTHVSLYFSLGLNLLYAAMNLFFGAYYGSVWYGTLAVYYILLAVMRFLLLQHVNRNAIGKELILELRQYRLCGVILMLMNIALLGVVVLVVLDNEGFHYAGYLIYVVAMYAFYNITSAVLNLIKYHRYKSPVMSAAKAIQLAAALVSMLSLETAMLTQFGEESGPRFRQLMTGLTGAGVCLVVLATAGVMIIRSTKRLKHLRNNGMEP